MRFNLYNKPFKVGVAVTVAIFVVANFMSYMQARRELSMQHEMGIRLSNLERLNWGFPYPWFYDPSGLAVMINLSLYAFLSFVAGFTFRYLFSRRDS